MNFGIESHTMTHLKQLDTFYQILSNEFKH